MSNVRELTLEIDENNLLNEWKGQAAMMLQYGIQYADAMQEEDEARAALDVVKAELDAMIRANPDEYKIGKITEATVAAAILLQPAHVAALTRQQEAQHGVRMLRAAVDAIGHRKSSLQGMTDLFLRQWYADPASAEQPVELRAAAKTATQKTIPGRKVRRREE